MAWRSWILGESSTSYEDAAAQDLEERIVEATFDMGPLRMRLSESTDGAVRVAKFERDSPEAAPGPVEACGKVTIGDEARRRARDLSSSRVRPRSRVARRLRRPLAADSSSPSTRGSCSQRATSRA